jgi:hypothetical protein
MNLQIPSCVIKVGTAVHEFLHSLGFFHEHTRADRDKSINIAYPNIRKGYESQFVIADPNATDFKTPYDFGSIMHYSLYAFAVDTKQKTIVNKTPIDGVVVGQRNALSKRDIEAINAMYC